MAAGIADILGSRPPEPRVVVTRWRMQGPSRVLIARIERHPFGRELVIAFDGAGGDVIETRFERVDFPRLEQRAEELRQLLVAKGWTEIRREPPS
jgi:hypothetical protein